MSRLFSLAGLAVLTLGLGACQTTHHPHRTASVESGPTPPTTTAPAAVVTLGDDHVPHGAPTDGGLQQAAWQPGSAPSAPCPSCPPGAHPGMMMNGGMACPPPVASGMPCPPMRGGIAVPTPEYAMMQISDDEYLCDGGDRDYPVHYNGLTREGLDTEDTIAEWIGSDGEFHVKPTNRVCIYSPRFGSVRTITSLHEGTNTIVASREDIVVQSGGLDGRLVLHERQHTDQTGRVRLRNRASELEAESTAIGVTAHALTLTGKRVVGLGETIRFLQTGRYETTDTPWISDGLQAAGVWSREDNPVVTAVTQGPQNVEVLAKATALKHVKDLNTPGDLRVVKLADRQVAKPGEEIVFHIRYDNIGDRSLDKVTIIDNLTPRLVFIEGSATSTRDADLFVEPNGEGSVVLRVKLEKPLPGHEGGTITFKTRVR